MLAGAIVVIGRGFPGFHWLTDARGRTTESGMLGGNPLACLDVLGRSVADRTVEKLRYDGVKLITIVISDEFSHLMRKPATREATINSVPAQIDLWSAAECVLRDYIQHGIELITLTRLGAYAEFDLVDLIRFHRCTKQGVTRVSKDHEPLDSWIIDATEMRNTQRLGLPMLLDREGGIPYPSLGYVCGLEDASDLRRLAVDGFHGHCSIGPQGREVRPGVWFDDGAQVHRSARVVAPAYVGRAARLRANVLLTRCSTVERGCDVQNGTAVEDTSVLANTYVGRGLNVAHAVVDGNKLFSLRQPIVVETEDGRLLGRTSPPGLAHSEGRGFGAPSLAQRLLATD